MSRKLGWVVVVLLIGAAAAWGFFEVQIRSWRPALSAREIATRVLAENLAGRFPSAKALVIGNPFTLRSGQSAEIYAFEKASVRGLEEGFGSPARVKVVHPELRPEFLKQPESVFVDPKTTTPLSYLVAENAFDQLVQANPGFDLVITLIGLPVRIRDSQLWRGPVPPRFGLLLPDWRMVGEADAIRDAFNSEKIGVAVISRPGAPREDEPVESKDYRAEFERRYLLVTKDNIADLLRTYPQLF